MQTTMPDTPTRRSLGLSRREEKRYSLARAIRASERGRLKQEAGFEHELSLAEMKLRGLREPMGPGSFYYPEDIAIARRDLTTNTAGYLVADENAPRGIIETTVADSTLGRLGVQRYNNMVGNATIPVTVTPASPTWLAEDGVSTISDTQPTIGQRIATPHTIAAKTTAAHRLLQMEPVLAERLAIDELTISLANGATTAFFQGTNADGQPQGVVGANGVGSVTGTSIAYGGLLEFQSDVLDANAMRAPGSFAYVCTPTVAKLLAGRQRFTNTDSPLWQGALADGTVAGARAVATLSAPASTIIAGDFSTAIVFTWPGLLLAADP